MSKGPISTPPTDAPFQSPLEYTWEAPHQHASPKRPPTRLADVDVDMYLVKKRHVTNESIALLFRSTGNLMHSWFSKEEDPQQQEHQTTSEE
ncbi:expressed unknown protein [Seminavis robusta]|uniref:Uncharacterized protein n=1 Tax=Seminavis robusta TaxID=568900 RepID=A0A9N8HKE5_9STRA|nr:expressed unknown protein [Seminavis robusta]|eukprot:Sro751_g197090.1 n/a (92) ;mRNA; f:29945-30220